MPDAPAAGGGTKGQVCDPKREMLLSFTCIYMIWWMWQRIPEINNYLGREAIKPLFFFIGLVCGPVMLYVDWLLVNAVAEMQQKAGIQAPDEKVMDMVWFLVCGPLGVKRIQEKLNAVWQK